MALGERSLSPLSPRSTAEGACALRAAGALERDPAVRCPDAMAADFLGGFNVSTLAKRRATRRLWLWGANRKLPGAGLDSRPYRLAEQLRGVRVLEVDHPASLDSKRARLRRLFGCEPEHVAFAAVDFNRDDLGAALAEAGHKRSARTLIVWSGVSMYLPEGGVADVLGWVGGHDSPPASIVFDAVWAGAIDGSRDYFGAAEIRRQVAELDEPLRWGIPEGRVAETLERFGLRSERVVSGEELRTTYLKRSDGALHDRPYGFGALLHARAG